MEQSEGNFLISVYMKLKYYFALSINFGFKFNVCMLKTA